MGVLFAVWVGFVKDAGDGVAPQQLWHHLGSVL